MRAAYLEMADLNVLAVDWSELLAMPIYFMSVSNMMGAAERVAEVVDFMVKTGILDLDRLHIIGHSLGAHLAGVTAENIQSGPVKRITGTH